jgi:hypothetical protein
MPTFDPSLSMRAARSLYFRENGFGEGDDGNYADAWVDFKIGPIPLPFPNSAPRVRAVRYHDLHHVLTGYATDTRSEFEIAAWEIGAGCGDFWAAWQLNLGGLAAGMMSIPGRTFRAFVRGRRSKSLYGRDFEALLDRTVGDLREESGVDRPAKARASDVALFGIAWVTGLCVGLATFAALIALLPLLALIGILRGAPRARKASAA